MKAIKEGGYIHLVNDEKMPLYCIKRNPVSALVPDKLGQPVAIESQTRASMCGNHCPFFEITADPRTYIDPVPTQHFVATLNCSHISVDVGVNEVIEKDQPKLTILK